MVTIDEIKPLLGDVLQLPNDRLNKLDASTPMLGGIPEFDSMAVVSVITALEEVFGILIEDDEISAETFETLETLRQFVNAKLAV